MRRGTSQDRHVDYTASALHSAHQSIRQDHVSITLYRPYNYAEFKIMSSYTMRNAMRAARMARRV